MTRVLLVVVGVLLGAYGAWLLLSRQDTDGNIATGTWLVAGVLLHDFLLVPVVLVVMGLGSRLLPGAWSAPVAVGVVVLGSLTLVAVPVLGRFGARSDNPTLLDRPYVAGWLVLAALVAVVVVAVSLLRSRRGAQSGAAPEGE
ncbi:hypothetical protein NPS01_37200 [Nocardioides psychrotolerans]|uniref:Uncharacterized protein n=1 Tax=Nocardioides psychrotolerans TaxID=1005945 RepID=A0A1I3Q966_9ACTN|nr:hypothetical protein [Nocardioides psychrotolerans]GEP40057.1 hypothetical protein NPS01_37200 [Nocardioides psychrotolerans]SFJ30663.1 hypothetical protein SAMN05216561_12410 [Nocardioides psychrotolerans]